MYGKKNRIETEFEMIQAKFVTGNVELRQSTMLNLKTKKRKRDSDCDKLRIKRNVNEKRKRDERERYDKAKA